ARTSESVVPSGKASWARTRSMSGRRRSRPRMMSPWTSASVASRSMVFVPGAAAGQQIVARDARALGLDFRPQGLGFFVAPLQISTHFVRVPEVVGDGGVYVGQRQGVIGADDL